MSQSKSLVLAAVLLAMSPAIAMGDCYTEAAIRYSIHPNVLKAIAMTESGENNAAINTNTNGSQDFCAMQINTVHVPDLMKHNIKTDDLLRDECLCVNVGAWILSKNITRYGNTWKAVAAYHSATPSLGNPYALKVYEKWVGLPNSPVKRDYPTSPIFMSQETSQ